MIKTIKRGIVLSRITHMGYQARVSNCYEWLTDEREGSPSLLDEALHGDPDKALNEAKKEIESIL